MDRMTFETLRVSFDDNICSLQIARPGADNSINERLIEECHRALDLCRESARLLVITGTPQAFCTGADFKGLQQGATIGAQASDPQPLYDLWERMTLEPYVVIAHARGRTNAGGIGFLAASDIVIADAAAQFSLSELLFGLFPACVLPFLTRRIGHQHAHYLTLMTHAISAQQAADFGLVDVCDANSDDALRKHVLRLRRLSKTAIGRYKQYMSELNPLSAQTKERALRANRALFSDPQIRQDIARYVESGTFPWER